MMKFIDEEKFAKSSGIYKIRNTISGLTYIGQTKQKFIKRYLYHRWRLRTNTHDNKWLQASYNKHGEDAFEFVVVEVVSNFDQLNDLEMHYIETERLKGHCCNITDGGDGAKGIPLSLERRKELGELNRILNTGKKASAETKAKMSKARRGKKRSKECIEKVIQTKANNLLNGGSIAQSKLKASDVYEIKRALMNNISYETIARQFNVSASNINAIRTNRSWKFVEVEGWEEYCKTHTNNTKARQSRSAN